MLRDFINNFKITQVIDPAVATQDVNGSSVDMKSYRHCVFVAQVGESGDTLGSGVRIELEVEESADDSSFTDVADSDLANEVAGVNDGCFGVIDAAAEDDAYKVVQYNGSKRYVRPVINLVGTHSNGTPIGVIAIQFGKVAVPVA